MGILPLAKGSMKKATLLPPARMKKSYKQTQTEDEKEYI